MIISDVERPKKFIKIREKVISDRLKSQANGQNVEQGWLFGGYKLED